MTADVIALCSREPNADAILAAVRAAAPGLRVRPVGGAALIQLCDDDGRELVTIESPLLVRARGEADRILGHDAGAPHPAWWVEARAPRAGTGARPGGGFGGGPGDSPKHPGGREIARGFAEALVAATGGCTWVSR
jgi:hypothetical protein